MLLLQYLIRCYVLRPDVILVPPTLEPGPASHFARLQPDARIILHQQVATGSYQPVIDRLTSAIRTKISSSLN